MGDLLNSLFGGNQGPKPIDLATIGGFAGPIEGNPIENPLSPVQGDPLPVPLNPQEEAVAVKGWKPKKQSFLGALADQYLMSQGMRPAFKDRMDNRNMQNAMEGFTQEPLEAIRRMAQIPDMQGKAWELYNQIIDNQRAQGIADDTAFNRQEKFYTRVGGMLNAIQNSKDPSAAYRNALPTIRRYAEARRLDVSDLTDDYNSDIVNNYIMGNVGPEDQMRMAATDSYRRNRLELYRQKAEDLRNYRTERLEDFDNAEAGREDRFSRGEAGKNARSSKGGSPMAGKAFKDSNGSLVEWNSKGDKIKVTEPNGRITLYKNGVDGKRVPVWAGSSEEYKALTARK